MLILRIEIVCDFCVFNYYFFHKQIIYLCSLWSPDCNYMSFVLIRQLFRVEFLVQKFRFLCFTAIFKMARNWLETSDAMRWVVFWLLSLVMCKSAACTKKLERQYQRLLEMNPTTIAQVSDDDDVQVPYNETDCLLKSDLFIF